jgi:hypothetical protein
MAVASGAISGKPRAGRDIALPAISGSWIASTF